MSKVKMCVARERRGSVLDCLSRAAGADGCAVVSLKGLVSTTGLTHEQVRSCLRALEREGFLVVEPRKNPDGGTAENAYRITEKAHQALLLPS